MNPITFQLIAFLGVFFVSLICVAIHGEARK